MLEHDALVEALEIQQRSRRLLRWIEAALDQRQLKFEEIHDEMSEQDAAAGWLAYNHRFLPEECRPAAATGPALQRFANFLASYLEVSYDLVESPMWEEREREGCACRCSVCFYLWQAPHLQPKRLNAVDAHRADLLLADHVAGLAEELGRPLDRPALLQLLTDPALAGDAALVTYGAELLRRCDGLPSGPETLALWRRFAWTPAGAPLRGFELRAEAILAAQQRLVTALAARPSPG
ncbi:hypothetical protein [Nannocystis punicea]|uniref:Uncharacterized protein n=1 Tax=Nannocystis punicea TaxID=2995304 RepID=A0ABY7GXN3_9BACT|nr:hypothetical protein [Nannocystis poenicansa]WAS91738.1 hypothetical protein O0S08_36615 [Nannocystis poenicansa]